MRMHLVDDQRRFTSALAENTPMNPAVIESDYG